MVRSITALNVMIDTCLRGAVGKKLSSQVEKQVHEGRPPAVPGPPTVPGERTLTAFRFPLPTVSLQPCSSRGSQEKDSCQVYCSDKCQTEKEVLG